MKGQKKLLMVCLGNICRSPMAEGIAKKASEEYQLNWKVDSAGTADYHIGDPPDPRSIKECSKHQIDITKLRGRQFVVGDFDRFDHIYAMDTSNMDNILSLARDGNDRNKVSLILSELYPQENRSVPDPYWDDNGFAEVYEMLEQAIKHIAMNDVSESIDV